MSSDQTFEARPLTAPEVPEALAFARGAGVHGVYAANILHAHPRLGPEAQFITFRVINVLIGLAYFGPRGNLLVLEAGPGAVDPEAAAAAILAIRNPWRIALAPEPIVAELLLQGRIKTLVNREQVYYEVVAATLAPLVLCEGGSVRRAEKKDLEPLMQAALQLNQSDLLVDPWRVDRDWLKKSTKARIRKRATYVIGAVGAPRTKLDLGSVGPAGVVIEGVYTWPEFRGNRYRRGSRRCGGHGRTGFLPAGVPTRRGRELARPEGV